MTSAPASAAARHGPRPPGILADRQAEPHAPVVHHRGAGARLEIALLVEDRVVGQDDLAVAGEDPSGGDEGAAVVDALTVVFGIAQVDSDAFDAPLYLFQRGCRSHPHAAMQEQVFRRITAQRQFGENRQVASEFVPGAPRGQQNLIDVGVDRAHMGIELCQRDFQSGAHVSPMCVAKIPADSTGRPRQEPCPAPTRLRLSPRAADCPHDDSRSSASAIASPSLAGERTVTTPGLLQRLILCLCGAAAGGNDGAGMPHAFPRRRGDAGNVGDHGLAHVGADVLCGGFFVAAADLAHQDDAVGVRVGFEQLQTVDEVHAANRVAADTDAGRLSETPRWSSAIPLHRSAYRSAK